MTFSAEQYRENIGRNEELPKRTRSYFQQRFQQQVFARIAKAFALRAEEFDLTKSNVATLIGKDKAQLNRLLSHPTNMTIDTISEIAFALNFEPEIILQDLSENPRHNFSHPAYDGFEEVLSPCFIYEESEYNSSNFRMSPKDEWEVEFAR